MSVESSNTPSLWEGIHRILEDIVSSWFTGMPAQVVEYDAETQTASVQPVIKSVYRDEGGDRQVKNLSIINGVPVVFPGGGGYRLLFPLTRGDTVFLVMSTVSLDRWKAKGGIVDPEDERRFDLSDAVAFAQIRPTVSPWTDAPTDGMSVGRDGGPSIKITASEIQAGGTSSLALNSDLSRFNTALASAITALAANPTAAAALTALQTALNALVPPWPVGTSTLKGG